jgi:hypothetical protein
MRTAIKIFVLIVYTVFAPAFWLFASIITLPYIWVTVLSGKRRKLRSPVRGGPAKASVKPHPVPASTPAVSTTAPAPKPGSVDIAAKVQAGTMTPDDWRHVSVIHNREHKC